MKLLIIISILSSADLIAQTAESSTSETTPQETNTQIKNEKTTSNELSHEIINQIKNIFTASASAKDEKSAKVAISQMKQSSKKILSLKTQLETAEKPSTKEKQAFAIQMITFETEISEIYKTMFQTFENNSEDINKLIEPPISEAKLKMTPALTLINEYYPKKEMLEYIQAAKNKK